MNRRDFIIKSIGAAIMAGGSPLFMPSILQADPLPFDREEWFFDATRSFKDLLNEYFTDETLRAQILNSRYLLSTIPEPSSWQAQTISLPFIK